MLRNSLILCLGLISLSLKASHQGNGYIEYEITANNMLYVELHIHRDTNGISQTTFPRTLQGPFTMSLTYDPSRTAVYAFNHPACSSLLDFETYVYTGTASLANLNPVAQGHTFTYQLGSCLTRTHNINGCFGAILSFTIFPKPNAQGNLA